MGEVVAGNFITTLPIPPEKVLQAAIDRGLQEVVVVGFDNDGEFYFAGSDAGTPVNLHMLMKASYELMKTGDRIAEEGDPRGKPRSGA